MSKVTPHSIAKNKASQVVFRLAPFLFALILLLRSSSVFAAAPITFSGEVQKFHRFEKDIGKDLTFCLIPDKFGWTVFVGNKNKLEENFASVVTPPYRGVNHLHIEGWHFRNADNSGPNEAGEKNVNAPQRNREFYFVLNVKDFHKSFDALQKILWPYSFSAKEIKAAEHLQDKIKKAEGTLTIRDIELNTLEKEQQAGIDRMTFDVELRLP